MAGGHEVRITTSAQERARARACAELGRIFPPPPPSCPSNGSCQDLETAPIRRSPAEGRPTKRLSSEMLGSSQQWSKPAQRLQRTRLELLLFSYSCRTQGLVKVKKKRRRKEGLRHSPSWLRVKTTPWTGAPQCHYRGGEPLGDWKLSLSSNPSRAAALVAPRQERQGEGGERGALQRGGCRIMS